MRVKAQEKYSEGADCKEKVKEEGSAGKEENCKIYVKRQRSFGKEDFYENEVKRREKSGKTKFCKDGVKPTRKAGKAAAGGRMEKLRQAARQEAVKASKCEKLATGSQRQKSGRKHPTDNQQAQRGTVKW